MGRPPCCDKVGIKKGPWTPEEDIILVSYIQENGPGNWRSVPTNTGLLRCSKSCRLRWTNYLRPGIKRGAFTPHEEGMIIHLQALLGNKWAAIASYLPQRTDNDIKNYWNTHLKKKIKKFQSVSASDSGILSLSADSETCDHSISKSNGENKNMSNITNISSTYASSTENISRLLEGWMKTSPKETSTEAQSSKAAAAIPGLEESCELESLLSFQQNMSSSLWWEKYSSSTDSSTFHHVSPSDDKMSDMEKHPPPLSMLEKWLLDEAGQQVEGILELSSH